MENKQRQAYTHIQKKEKTSVKRCLLPHYVCEKLGKKTPKFSIIVNGVVNIDSSVGCNTWPIL